KNYEARFISIKYSGEPDYLDLSHIRILGREHIVNGTFEVKRDFGDDLYSVSAESFSDPNGDGNNKQLPMFISRQPICKTLKFYWKYYEASMKYGENTDFPVHTHPCPLPKGIYYIKNVTPQTDDWPAIMPRGFIKGVITIYERNEVVGTVEIVIQILDL
ncbi:hypothetical protein KR054_003645, partial [Drosophila jambulina]